MISATTSGSWTWNPSRSWPTTCTSVKLGVCLPKGWLSAHMGCFGFCLPKSQPGPPARCGHCLRVSRRRRRSPKKDQGRATQGDDGPNWTARRTDQACCFAAASLIDRSGAIRGRVRCTGWHLPDTSIVGKYAAAQTQSRRRSTAQPSPDDHRPGPDAHARPDEHLRRQTPSGRPNHQGNHAFNQALHHPATVPNPRRSTSVPATP